MEFKPEIVQALLFTVSALGVGLFVGGLAERMVLSRLRRRLEASGRESWKIWRGLGWWTGLWIAMRVVLSQSFLPEYWQEEADLSWKITGILIAMIYLGRLTGRLVKDNTSDAAGILPAVSLLNYVARGIVYVSGVLIILQALGISITPMVTALGVGGLAVALALQDTLSNLFAGVQIIASRKIEPGQFIRLEGGQEGTVADVTWRNTTLVTQSNMLVIVPNKTLSGSIVTNTHLPDSKILVQVDGLVEHDSDLELVERLLKEAAIHIVKTQGVAFQGDPPSVRFQAFGSSGIQVSVGVWARRHEDQFELRHMLIKSIHYQFTAHGIRMKASDK